jgi:Holliday junction resolvase RusA-like endonuclease
VTQPLVRLNDYALHGKAALSGLGEQRVAPVGAQAQTQQSVGQIIRQTVTLPAPPTMNMYWRSVKGRMLISREGRAYKKMVAEQVVASPCAGPVAVIVRWSRRKRMGDLDNRLKVILDSLRGIAFRDDKQVVELHAYRSEGGDDTVCVTWWAA